MCTGVQTLHEGRVAEEPAARDYQPVGHQLVQPPGIHGLLGGAAAGHDRAEPGMGAAFNKAQQ